MEEFLHQLGSRVFLHVDLRTENDLSFRLLNPYTSLNASQGMTGPPKHTRKKYQHSHQDVFAWIFREREGCCFFLFSSKDALVGDDKETMMVNLGGVLGVSSR